jgi:3-oxoacyl-[acyl-carrier protein] reductase
MRRSINLKRADEAEKTCSGIKDFGRRTVAVQGDVSVSTEVARLVESIERRLRTMQILVNNAGVVYRASLDNIPEEDWDRVIDINLKSAFPVTHAVLPGMRNNHRGGIINISSAVFRLVIFAGRRQVHTRAIGQPANESITTRGYG